MVPSALFSGANHRPFPASRTRSEVPVLTTAAWILLTLAGLVVLVDAFKRSTVEGLLCLFIPFYAAFHLFFRQQTYKGLALLLFFGSVGLGVAARGDLFGSSGPCDLVDKAQVEEAFGEKVVNARSSSTSLGEACLYETSGSPAKVLSVVLNPACPEGGVQDMSETRNRFRVSEVGDAAMAAGPDLLAQKGSSCLVVSYKAEGQDSQSSLPGRKRVAQLLSSKMK